VQQLPGSKYGPETGEVNKVAAAARVLGGQCGDRERKKKKGAECRN
jgi:hypothetical protein